MKALRAVVACILGALALLQLGSMALFSDAASAGSFPARIKRSTGERIYQTLERFAPSDTVEAMLARDDLANNRLEDARRRIVRMSSGAQRSELQGQLASAQGKMDEALRAYLAADDVEALQFEVDRLARMGRAADAYAFERRIVKHLATQTTHPDALAEAWWRLGQLASALATQSSGEAWLRNGQKDYERALGLAPFSEKYLLAAGFQALALHNANAALMYFTRAIDVNPASAEAYAGLGKLALLAGDLARSRLYAERSRNLNPDTAVLRDLERRLRQ
ncbi:MAG: hypothetical protein GIW98_03120 [Candidatus Eremiobacteraeota bacterium]|nr:hypothetical protein [Candidatus Eremiobacteraeota bacterium]